MNNTITENTCTTENAAHSSCKEKFIKRPVAVFTLSFFISVCVFAALNLNILPSMYIGAAVFTVVLIALLIIVKKHFLSVILKNILISVTGIILAGLFFTCLLYNNYYSFEPYYNTVISGNFRVESVNYTSAFSNSYTVSGEIDGRKVKVVAEIPYAKDIGNIIRIKGEVIPFGNSDGFDEFIYYRSKGAVFTVEAEECEYIGTDTSSLNYKIHKLRSGLCSFIDRYISEESASVLKAILIGDRSTLSDEIKAAFSRTGISHLLAISGMHIGIISAGASFVLKKVKLNKRVIAVIIPFLMLFYMGITGFSPSVIRAVFLCCASSVAVLCGISFDGITSLGVCGAVMLLTNPYAVYDIGMQMSFSAYLGCLAGVKILEKTGLSVRRKHLITRLSAAIPSTVVFTLTVVIFTLPVYVLHFDSISIISPLSNLVFIPLFTVVIYLGIFVCLLSWIPYVGMYMSHVADKYVWFVLKAVRWTAEKENITVSLKYGFAPVLIVVTATFLILAVCLNKKKYTAVFLALAVLTVTGYGYGIHLYNDSYADTVRVLRCGRGQNDVIMIASEGCVYAIDVNYGRTNVSSYIINGMSEFCETRLDGYVITHYGAGSLKTAKSLKEKYQLKKVFLTVPTETESEGYVKLTEYLDSMNIAYSVLPEEDNTLKTGCGNIVFAGKQTIKRSALPIVSFEVNGQKESLIYTSSAFTEAYDTIGEEIGFDVEDTLIVGAYGPAVKQPIKEIDVDLKNVYTFPKKAETNDNYYTDIPIENRMISTDSKVFVLN